MWDRWQHHIPGFVKECGGSGDSQLFSILEALKDESNVSIHWLRKRMAGAFSMWAHETAEAQLETYRERFRTNKLGGLWNPLALDIAGLRQQIVRPNETGNPYDFEEDEFTLQLLAEGLALNIWVFSNTTGEVWNTKTQFSRTICLLYHHLPHFEHYQLLGFGPAEGTPRTILPHHEVLQFPRVVFVDHLSSNLHIRSNYPVKVTPDLYLPKLLLRLSQWNNVCFSNTCT